MKKTLAIIVSFAFALMAITALTISPAAIVEGDWTTSRSGDDYNEDIYYFRPASGYEYTKDGFVTISPNYDESTSPYVQVHTKDPVDLKANNDGQGNSVSLEFTVLDFVYGGAQGEMDHWIAFTLNTQPIACHGTLDYGEGVCFLIRGKGDGSCLIQPHYVDKSDKGFSMIQTWLMPTVEVPLNTLGQEEYTFTVKYTNNGYEFLINDHVFKPDDHLNQLLDRVCSDGAYVGITMQTLETNSTVSMCINQWQGSVPYGEDSVKPEYDLNNPNGFADPQTVPLNQPALLWDSSMRDFSDFQFEGLQHNINNDGSIHLQILNEIPSVIFTVTPTIAYRASDFPYIAVLTRNCYANSTNLYYFTGNYCYENRFSNNTLYDDGWKLELIDLSEQSDYDWYGRMHRLIVEYEYDYNDINDNKFNNFDIGFIGTFRSPEEAYAYAEQYLTDRGYSLIPETVAPPETELATDAYTDYETEIETCVVSDFYEEYETAVKDNQAGLGGLIFGNGLIGELIESDLLSSCTSVTGIPAVIVLTILGFALVYKKKD